ncbi:hypothetical protein C0T31_11435 [Dysgonamonadaceae bacterium]|nr:hypothetical protein C0T31_11435 [Dysgonamonadaceae bacterium]
MIATNFHHSNTIGKGQLLTKVPISDFPIRFNNLSHCRAFHIRFYKQTASLVMFFTFYFPEIIRTSKDKQLFTNKTSVKEKISTYKRQRKYLFLTIYVRKKKTTQESCFLNVPNFRVFCTCHAHNE